MNEQKTQEETKVKPPLPYLAGLNKDDLKTEIERYKKAGVEISYTDQELAALKRPDLLSFTQTLQDENGVPFLVDEECIEANPDIDKKVGDFGLLPLDIFETKEETEARQEKEEAEKKAQGSKADNEPVIPTKKRHSFRGKEVLSIEDKLHNGRLYKEVIVSGESFLLTTGEFDQEVKEIS